MDSQTQQRLSMQILIGSAWADRQLNPGEIAYLQQVLSRYQLAHDPELTGLLATPVPLEQTERWMVAYLQGSNDTERLQLLANIGNLLIADDIVSDADHALIDEYHNLMAQIPAQPETSPRDLVGAIGKSLGKVLKSLSRF